jgi:tetratricopeptide (TPR) repeat protein
MLARRVHTAHLLTVCLVALTATSAGAADWPIKRGPSREPVPYQYQPDAWKKLPREFLDDFPACTIYSGLSYLIEPDGTVEKITHEVTRFTGRKGIERLGEYRNITYDPSYETLTLNEARVFKADGKIVAIEPKHVQLRDTGTDYFVYEPDKQLVISFPNLEVGDTIDVKWTTRGKHPEHGEQFFTRYTFGDDRYPCAVDEMRIRLPRARKLHHAATGGKLEPTVKEDGDWRTFHWRTTNKPPLPQDDNLPSREELRLAVACSTFADWKEVGVWKRKLRKDCWACSEEIRKVVADITGKLKTPEEKARALTYWVRRHVRYVSVGTKHDYTPHQPAQVLSNRYGDCKDQSQLLAVMLREAGIPVALATLGTLDDGQVLEVVPSPWGTHAILLVTINGQNHWIDTTSSLAGWDYLPRDDRNRVCYVIAEKAADNEKDAGLRLIRTPALKAEENLVVNQTHMTIGADGSSRSERSSEYTGAAALTQRGEWVEVPPGERRRGRANELLNAQNKAHLLRFEIDEKKLRDFDQPVAARVVFEVPGHFSGETELEGSLTDSRVWSRLLSTNLDYDRKVPLDLGVPFESVHTYRIQLAPGLRLESSPKNQCVQSKWGTFELTVKAEGEHPRHLELTFHTKMDSMRIAPEDFDEFRKFHEQVFKHYRVWLTAKPSTNVADAPALEALLAAAPCDVASTLLLARLYRHDEQAKEARRVLRRTIYYHPQDVRLRELQVNLAENRQEEEDAYAELIKHAPEESKHSVALAESRVNRGDFAGAQKALEPVLKKGSKKWRAQAHFQLARCSLQQNQAAEAFKQLEEVARVDPDSARNIPVLLLAGKLHDRMGQVKDAIEDYQNILKREENEEALEALVRLYLKDKDNDRAMRYLRRYAVAIDRNVGGLVKAAEMYMEMKRDDDAFDLATRARDLEFSADTQRILGILHMKRGDYTKAAFHLDRATRTGPVLEAVIESNLALGKLSEAIKQAEHIESVKGPTASLRRTYITLLGLIQRRLEVRKGTKVPKDKEDAATAAIDALVCAEHAQSAGRPRQLVDTLLATSFKDGIEVGPAFALRGQFALEQGKLTRAFADAERALKLSPKEARAHYVRGRVRLERGQEGALADLSKAAELSERKDAMMLYWLAQGLRRAGAKAEALTALREAATLRPQDEEIADELVRWEKEK